MLTRNERRQLEAQWNSDDRTIASYARLIKTSVLSIIMVGLLWIAGTDERADNAREATATSATQGGAHAMRASQRTFAERRAQWQGSAKPVQQAATR